MAPKSDASIRAKKLKDEGKNRHEARWELQKEYGRLLTKSRLSQLLSEHWNAGESSDASGLMQESSKQDQPKDQPRDANGCPQSMIDRKAFALDAEILASKKRSMAESDSTDSSNVRAKDRS